VRQNVGLNLQDIGDCFWRQLEQWEQLLLLLLLALLWYARVDCATSVIANHHHHLRHRRSSSSREAGCSWRSFLLTLQGSTSVS